MLRRLFSLGARIFVALVMIGLIGQQITSESSGPAPGPKFVKPYDSAQVDAPAEEMTFATMVDLAMTAARDMLGSPEQQPPKSSLEQLRQRSGS